MILNKDKLASLIMGCMNSISLCIEYSYDQSIADDDYSYELVFDETLFDIMTLERTISNLYEENPFHKEVDFIYESFEKIIDSNNTSFFKRLTDYENACYSKSILENHFNILKNSLENGDELISNDNAADQLFEILRLKDKAELFASETKITKRLKTVLNTEIFITYSKSIDKYIKKHFNTFKILSDYIIGYRNNHLIPNSSEYNWWYSFHSLTSENLIQNLETYVLQNESLAKSIGQKLKDLDLINKLQHSVKDSLVYARQVSEKLNDIIDTTFMPDIVSSEPIPDVWGEESQISIPDSEPIPSDHEMNDRFYDIFEVNKQAIMQAIEVIEADDIDEQKRKETVAILYLMLGENNEALKRLDED